MFQFFNKKQKQRTYSFPHQIWKVMPDNETGRLLIEVREKDLKAPRYACIDPSESTDNISLHKLFDTDWNGLQEVYGGCAFFHGYEDASLPIPKGIYAFSLPNLEKAWERDELVFEGLTETGLLAHFADQPEGEVLLLDQKTGAELQRYASRREETLIKASDAWFEAVSKQRLFPETHIQGTPEFEKVVNQYIGTQVFTPIFQVQLLSYGVRKALSFFSDKGEGKWDQLLEIYERDELYLRELIGSGDGETGRFDSFFVFDGVLVFVVGGRELRVVGT